MILPGVTKTAVLTLRARADEHGRADAFFRDPLAVEWLDRVGWPPELDGWYVPKVQTFLAARAHEIDLLAEEAVRELGAEAIVELGAGLSTRRRRLAHLGARFVDVDLEPVIECRRALGAPEGIACSVADDRWFDSVSVPPDRAFLIAEGLFYYLPRIEVDALFLRMRRRFPRALIAFDVLGDLDFGEAQKNATAAGAPMEWKVSGFREAFDDLGVDGVEAWNPKDQMMRSIDRTWPRFGKLAHLSVRLFAEIDGLANRRSGTIAGRLRPIGG
jgi:O-methyltransferase involved in polyketide biosynthesis